MTYWPWWLGALGLAGVGHVSCRLLGRPLGVSGYLSRIMNWRAERQAEKQQLALLEDEARLQRDLMEATLREFADKLPHEELARLKEKFLQAPPKLGASPQIDVKTCLTFALGLILGGFLAAVQQSRWSLQIGVSPEMLSVWGSYAKSLAVLFFGGLLVGFGTTLAGGCTSGHGLSGCSRFQPGSIAATAVFLVTAIIVSLYLGGHHG